MSNKLSYARQIVKDIIDLSTKSAILADPKSKQFCQEYSELSKISQSTEDSKDKVSYKLLEVLCKDHGIKTESLYTYMKNVTNNPGNQPDLFKKNFKQVNFDKLNANLKPEYYNLFQSLGRVNDGVKTLVNMRNDVLQILESKKIKLASSDYDEDFKIMNSVLKNLLTLWFSTGLLNVKRIDWNSPASLVEKVAVYESVHKMRTLNDLKKRLSESRRCFIYTHSTMPYEPLVILHIALTNEVTSNIRSLIKTDYLTNQETTEKNVQYTNAIFYSINSCHKGLQQVDLGNALIKSCVHLLLEEIPSLKNFHTLSPIPKFREWIDLKLSAASSDAHFSNEYFNIEKALKSDEISFLLKHFETNNKAHMFEKLKVYTKSNEFKTNAPLVDLNEPESSDVSTEMKLARVVALFLQRSCAFYLYREKKNGYAFNPVANFHLRNGAHIYRINYKGDLSDNGWQSSYGFMVNYGYKLEELEKNCISYLIDKSIKTSEMVKWCLIDFETKVPSKI